MGAREKYIDERLGGGSIGKDRKDLAIVANVWNS